VLVTVFVVRRLSWLVVVVSVLAGASACVKTKPVTVADGPPLAMPPPPNRAFAPREEPIPVQAPPPEVADAEPPKPAPARPVPRWRGTSVDPRPATSDTMAAPARLGRGLR